LALGEFHGIALTSEGSVLTWGMEQGPEVSVGTGKKLAPGLGELPERVGLNQKEPRTLDVPCRAVEVAAGAYHSALITEDGKLWLWGSNEQGQLGIGRPGAPAALHTPVACKAFGAAGTRDEDGSLRCACTSVSLGGFHSAALDVEGRLFTWGDNRRGQCGHGEAKGICEPKLLQLASDDPLCVFVSCGGFFTLLEAYPKSAGASQPPSYFACGWGKDGCLGFGQACKRMLRPQPLPRPLPGHHWTKLWAGAVHVAGLLAQTEHRELSY